MRRALAITIITLALAGVTIAAFGWPGEIIALCLAPGLILGSVMTHVVDAWIGRGTLRIIYMMLGTVLGIFSAMVAMLFMGASTAPEHVRLERSRLIPLPAALIWECLEEPTAWGQWDAWLGRIEPTEPTPAGARRYATTLMMGTTEVPAHHVAAETEPGRHMAWQIELAEGSAFRHIHQVVTLSPEGDATRVSYRLTYDLPTLTARALHSVMFARGLEATADTALEALEGVARARDQD